VNAQLSPTTTSLSRDALVHTSEIEYETNPVPVSGFDNFTGVNFGGLSTNFRYNAIGRGPGAPIGAAFNAIYHPETFRDFGSPDWMKAATLGLTTALTYRLAPNVTLGGELEYYRAQNSLGFSGFAGHALYAGPTLYVKLTNKIRLAAAFSTQITGHAVGEPDPLDLTNFSRNKARLLVEFEF
jgi:hypothetical protein